MSEAGGRLVVVATPIGNLGDLSPRAVEALAGADVIACEDTRRTRALLTAAGVRAPRLLAVHDANEAERADAVVALLEGGTTVALVSDAGTPAVSDPGQRVVAAAVAAGHPVTVVPGPSAAIAALVASGLPTDRFVFEGFLPRKGAERGRRLAATAAEQRTVVLYEAPHRVARTAADLAAACGPDRPVALARELTKVHEEVWRGTLRDLVARVAEVAPRGEHVLVLGGAAEAAAAGDADIEAALADRLAAGDDRRAAVAAVTEALGVPRRRVYELSLGKVAPPASPSAQSGQTGLPR
ncbi:MAG TPA: 16S rRNA (cytidine(1402)-2'-O)-methyltransferase [Acidimicrobiales bacterium]|nr:16S rRNA (cytidine(1402)-2'-O)-methyltransferase [Acidimicrobiales bacterium]